MSQRESLRPCEDIRPLLFALIEGEVTAEERAVVTAHVEACASCRQQMADERMLTEALAANAPERALELERSPEWERGLQPRIGHLTLLAAGLLGLALLAQLAGWTRPSGAGSGPLGSIVTSSLGPAFTWLDADSSSLRASNHVSIPAGSRATIQLEGTGALHADGPVSFEVDRTAESWKVTLHGGAVDLEVSPGANVRVASQHGMHVVGPGTHVITADAPPRSGRTTPRQDPLVQLWKKGKKAFDDGDFAAAEKTFLALLERAPESSGHAERALFFLWCSQASQKRYEDALKSLDRWLDRYPESESRSYARYFRGLYLYLLERTDEAREAWEQLLRDDPEGKNANGARKGLERIRLGRAGGRGVRQQRDVGPASSADEDRLARQCASEIGWLFGTERAMERARADGKPVLVYVRCVNQVAGLDSARESIAAAAVRLGDDGLGKDLLFRAGALADPEVGSLIARRFVPLCLTYHFATHGKGRGDPDWSRPRTRVVGHRAPYFDAEVGAAAAGSLVLDSAGSLLQSHVRPDVGGEQLRLSASIKTRGLDASARAGVRVLWSPIDRSGQRSTATEPVQGDADWTRVSCTIDVPGPLMNILVMPTMSGSGKVWFDDLELVALRGGVPVGPNLIRNGGLDPAGNRNDPLTPLGLAAPDVVTPALVVLAPDGSPVRKLDRIGVASADHVDLWLRQALRDAATPWRGGEATGVLLEAGELDRVLARTEKAGDPGARLHRARALRRLGRLDDAEVALKDLSSPEVWAERGTIALRRGSWTVALAAFERLGTGANSAQALLWAGLCHSRLGQHAAAHAKWRAAAGPTPAGRRAAAFLRHKGPHPQLGTSVRAWPRNGATWSPAASLRLLLEMQGADGSFGDHRGRQVAGALRGPWVASYTALGAEAMQRWRDRLTEGHAPALNRAAVDAALDRAGRFLVRRAEGAPSRLDAFDDPYVLDQLLRLGEKDAAARVAARIEKAQLPDGCWSVYGPQRPTSFNTAQNLIALLHARKAGIAVGDATIDSGVALLESMRRKGDVFPYAPARGFQWMTTEFGSIARDPLCEHALLLAGRGSIEGLARALDRFCQHHAMLRAPTKQYSSDFNTDGHGSYFFFYAHRNALEAAEHADAKTRARVREVVRSAVLGVGEGDGSFVDHYMYGRGYGTAMALCILGRE